MSKSRIIGGVFGLPEPRDAGEALPALDDPQTILLVNGRSAIDLVLRGTGATRVWLPSYICISVVEAVGPREICWYDVGDALTPCDEDWLDDVIPGDVVLFVNYFGWRESVDWYGRAAARGAIVVEDGSQSLLTANLGEGANYSLYRAAKVCRRSGRRVARARRIHDARPGPACIRRGRLVADRIRRQCAAAASSIAAARAAHWFAAFGAAEAEQPSGPDRDQRLLPGASRPRVRF